MTKFRLSNLTLSNNNIDEKSSSKVIGDIFVCLYQVTSACAVRFSVSGDTKAVYSYSSHFVAILEADCGD